MAIYIFSSCTLFMLHFFHTAPFPRCTFLCRIFSCCTFFPCCTLFMYCTISCCTLTRCKVFVLHSSPFALFAFCTFSCCTLFMLRYFQRWSQDRHKHLRWRDLQQQLTKPLINKAVKYCCKALHLRCRRGSWLRFYYFAQHFFNIEKYWKWTKGRKHNQKNDITTVNLFHFYFDIIYHIFVII